MNAVDICNQALVSLGMNPIVSLEGNDNSSVRCRTLFPICRDRMLREHIWSFALSSVPLQKLAETSPRVDFPIAAALPVDCIRAVRLNSGRPYILRQNRILITAVPDSLEFVSRIDNAELFDAAFADALASLIAAELALYGTHDAGILQFHQQQYARKIAAAKSIDSIENIHLYQRRTFRSELIAARRCE